MSKDKKAVTKRWWFPYLVGAYYAVIGLVLIQIATGGKALSFHRSPVSVLDGKPMTAGSWHKAHVIAGSYDDFILDDNSEVEVQWNLLGPSPRPFVVLGTSGTIYASVPLGDSHADRSEYMFQKFVPDGGNGTTINQFNFYDRTYQGSATEIDNIHESTYLNSSQRPKIPSSKYLWSNGSYHTSYGGTR